jgi:predicted RNase H-like HicB family nuclease
MARTSTHYLALIHKDGPSGYGVSFPDVPGVVAVADTLDEAISEGAAALQFAFEDWNGPLPVPRTLDALRGDAGFQADAVDAIVAAIRPSYSYYQAAE